MKCNRYSDSGSLKSCCSTLTGGYHRAAEINNHREQMKGFGRGGKNQCHQNAENKISVASLRDFFFFLTS